MDILTKFQTAFLKEIAQTPINSTFFLTGGTALSAFYLQHRLSEDLDFFTEEPGQIPQVLSILQRLAPKLTARVEVRRQFASFLEIFLHSNDGEILKCDFAQDSPFRHQAKVHDNATGVFVDNALDIACNKLSALFDRSAMKDFVDVYFIDKELFSFAHILQKAREKHVGIDDYWLAISLRKVQELDVFPRMVKTLDIHELRDFFLGHARRLMQSNA